MLNHNSAQILWQFLSKALGITFEHKCGRSLLLQTRGFIVGGCGWLSKRSRGERRQVWPVCQLPSTFIAPSQIPDPNRSHQPHIGTKYASNLLINTTRKPYTKSLMTKHLFNNSVLTLSTHERWKKQTLRFILSNKCEHLTPSQYNNNKKTLLFFFSSHFHRGGCHARSLWVGPQ